MKVPHLCGECYFKPEIPQHAGEAHSSDPKSRGSAGDCLEEEEIVILLSNLLDNAIRESEKVLKNTGKAVIHLKLECEDHKLIFAVRNPVTEKVEIENDTIKSKRGDHHGIGLLNVKAVVDKYGGDMVLSCDENEFKAVVIL